MNHFSDFEYQKQRFQKNLIGITPKDQEFIKKALDVAKKQHSNQKRHSGNPYLIHCLRITNNLMEKMNIFDKETLAAALLHDTVEDTNYTIEDVKNEFNARVAEIVDNLTRNTKGENETNKYERKYAKYQETLTKDIETKTIKALDHLDNVTSWTMLPKNNAHRKKLARWIKEAETIHLPMAKEVSDDIAKEIEEKLEIVKTL